MIFYLQSDVLECEVKGALGSITPNKTSGGDGRQVELFQILKETSPEYSLEQLMPKLKLQYFGHLMRRTDSLEMTLMLGKIEGRRRRGRQRMRLLDDITNLMDRSLNRLSKLVMKRKACCAAVHGAAKSQT